MAFPFILSLLGHHINSLCYPCAADLQPCIPWSEFYLTLWLQHGQTYAPQGRTVPWHTLTETQTIYNISPILVVFLFWCYSIIKDWMNEIWTVQRHRHSLACFSATELSDISLWLQLMIIGSSDLGLLSAERFCFIGRKKKKKTLLKTTWINSTTPISTYGEFKVVGWPTAAFSTGMSIIRGSKLHVIFSSLNICMKYE